MKILRNLFLGNRTKKKILIIKDDIKKIVAPNCDEKFFIDWYGAYEIDPKHLVYWICVKTDSLKNKLAGDEVLNSNLRELLNKHDYPEPARKHVFIGFESQETVDRESAGNWFHHFK
ncbi:hypothetical protein D770_05015 [Flammeovirgaceae bacterium 311]|nr:hypothetical protein D770_05015 [Flammeovirgaceae bacterium 311]